ncbi:patatin-like phospholipase, putative [Plasmodium sp. gorilla clade G2]|uniref:patatin-like phospholipase, putative n=1 Tax=Plasmodium sp. gorilla clade G2 TaxID=880535 RepID=UPI000D2171DF|nr:patatin-like phospholipase, putative [Plasmodium sp. gorilla clade G2]SOV18400.1 patatin-like phospholipase, putative [Plasmodium sp. gorilla clade G2]
MVKNVYIYFVYLVYLFHMFSLSLRMQKNIFKYITPLSNRFNLTKIRKLKLFRKEKQKKQVTVFNHVVNNYIGLDLFFTKLNNITSNHEKLNYINFLQQIVEDKAYEHLLFSNNYMRIIIYILNEKCLVIKNNEEKYDDLDYEIIYRILLIFKNLTRYKSFYHVILNDYTHKNKKISLLYTLMNILNEKNEFNNNNFEKYKEYNSIFNYFTSFFKNAEDTKNYITPDSSSELDSKMKNEEQKENEKKSQINQMKNKIFDIGRNILLKLKDEKLKIENKLKSQYVRGSTHNTNQTSTDFKSMQNQEDVSLEKKKNDDDHHMDNDNYNTSENNFKQKHINITDQNQNNKDRLYDDTPQNDNNTNINDKKYVNDIEKKTNNIIDHYNEENDITNNETKDIFLKNQSDVLFVPFYFNKNTKDNILTSIIINFLNNKNIIVSKKKIKNMKGKGNIIEHIGQDYNCNNYFDIYENFVEDDKDILKYEKNNNMNTLNNKNSMQDVNNEYKSYEDDQFEYEIEDEEEYSNDDDFNENKEEDKKIYERKLDENDINIIFNEYKYETSKLKIYNENKTNSINMGLMILIRKNNVDTNTVLNMHHYNNNDIEKSINNKYEDSTNNIKNNEISPEKEYNKNNNNNNNQIYEDIYVKSHNQIDRKETDNYVLNGFIKSNLDLLKPFNINDEDDNNMITSECLDISNNNCIDIKSPYLNFVLLKNYIESLFTHINLNDYFTNKLLKLLYEILIENKNSIIYNLYYYTILKDENIKKVTDILSKNVKNNLNKANTTLLLRIFYIMCFQKSFYINTAMHYKTNEKYAYLYKNIAKYIQDIKEGEFIKQLQKQEDIIKCLKNLSLFFENKYKNQNSFYISDVNKDQYLYEKKIFKKKLNNIYNRHYICEYKDLIIIRKTNIILKSLGINMYDLYNDIIFLDREKKTHEYLMKETYNKKNIINYMNDIFFNIFNKFKTFFTYQREEEPILSASQNKNINSNTMLNENRDHSNKLNTNENQIKRLEDKNNMSALGTKSYQNINNNNNNNNNSNSFKNDSDFISSSNEEQIRKKNRTVIYNLNDKEYISFDKFKNIVIDLKKKKKRKLRILCLDGGGIRGLLSIEILKYINSNLNKNIFEYFDIICGTSTGAIISILIGLEKAHLNEIEFLYNLLINKIFQKDTYAVRNTRYLLKHSYYDSNILNNILNSFFKNIKMFHYNSDFFTPYVFTVSTQMNITPLQPVLLKNYNGNLHKIRESNIVENNKNINHNNEYVDENDDHNINTPYNYTNDSYDNEENNTQTNNNVYDRINDNNFDDTTTNNNNNNNNYYNSNNNDIHINQNISNVSIYKSFYNIFVKYVLRCTTAAPGFFNFFSFDNNIYADGAICFNNPTLLSLNELKIIFYNYINTKKTSFMDKLKCFFFNKNKSDNNEKNKEKDVINMNDYIDCIVSIGTGKFKPKVINELNENKSYDTFLRWDVLLKQIVYSITNTELTHDICNNLLDKNKYFRFNCFINNIKLDETSPEIIMKLKQIGKRYFEDHKYNQQKLIRLINILEDKEELKKYEEKRKKHIWNDLYINSIKSKISNLIFNNDKMNSDSSFMNNSFLLSKNNHKNNNQRDNPKDSSKNNSLSHTKDNHNIDTNNNNNNNNEKKNKKLISPYLNFNFNLMEEGDKFDLNNIEEILDMINKNNNSFTKNNTSSSSSSSGFINYFTKLFSNNNLFLEKLESVNKSNIFNRNKNEKNNYVNVIPNTGIRILLNEIYFILLKKNLYFHTDEYNNLTYMNNNDDDLNIDRMITHDNKKTPNGSSSKKGTNTDMDQTNENISNENTTDENTTDENQIEQNQKEQNQTEQNQKEQNQKEQNQTEQNQTEQNQKSRKEDKNIKDNKNKIMEDDLNLNYITDDDAIFFSENQNNEQKTFSDNTHNTSDNSIDDELIHSDNTVNLTNNPNINKNRNSKFKTDSNQGNYDFFNSEHYTDNKKINILDLLRCFFFKKET